MKRFEEFKLSIEVMQGIKKMGYETPTKIQEQAIPIILTGKDVIGLAQTGTGKTLTFASSMLSILEPKNDHCIKAVVLSPTRELVIQIENEMKKIGQYTKTKIVSVYGGSKIEPQIKSIKRGADIIVATPGRLMDLMRRKVVSLQNVEMVVLDEADEMLNMGFVDDIEAILNQTNDKKQTVLFSATMKPEIEKIAHQYMNEDVELIKVDQHVKTASTIKQYYVETKSKARIETLCRIIDFSRIESGIIFCRTKRGVDELVFELKNRNYLVEGIHGDLSQEQRVKALRQFKEGATTLLVATDVVARGIDIENVTHVINYELPQEKEAYVHRIGRTGRASKKGTSITLITGNERHFIRSIQKQMNCTVEKMEIPTNEQILEVKSQDILTKASHYCSQKKNQRFVELMKEYDYKTLVDLSSTLFSMIYEKEIGFNEAKQVSKAVQYETLRFSVGKKDRIQSKHILFFILDHARINKKVIGHIEVRSKFTEVEIEPSYVDTVLKKCNGQKLNRNRVKITII